MGIRHGWGWPESGGYARPHYPAGWQQPSPGEAPVAYPMHPGDRPQYPFPPGTRFSRWFQSFLAKFPPIGQNSGVGGTALKQRFPDLGPAVVRPAFTGPYERKFMRSWVRRNRSMALFIEYLNPRPEPQAVRHSQPPRVRPALDYPRQRFSAVDDSDLMARARARAFGGR